jgi:hypothetical protein
LKLGSELSALLGALREKLLQPRILDVVGGRLESILSVAAGLDQVIQTFN